MRVEELMSQFPETCDPDETLSEATQKMQRSNHALLPVTAGAGSQRLVGVITDGDIRMAAQLQGRGLGELRARDVMAMDVRVCTPADGSVKAEEIMRKAHIHGLPVVDESGRIMGVISLADITHQAEREALIAQISAAQFDLGL